jgi:pyruvate dehydrogenase E2 component (dihydrolipoamide acetyltransferase)
MAQLIRVPELGIAIANVTIVEWMVKEGERVSRGDALLEVLTDKMVMEVPAEASGTLRKIFFQEEAQLTIGVPIAIIGEAGENIDHLLAEAEAELQALSEQLPEAMAVSAAPAVSLPVLAPAPPAHSPSGKILASPLAKRLAREKGVDLALVSPTGKGGKITQEDVLAYCDQIEAVATPPAPAVRPATDGRPVTVSDEETEIIPFKGTRKAIADNMIRSVQMSAHYTMGIDADCAQLVALRDRLREEFRERYGVELTYVPFMVKAIAMAVKDHPIVNATLRENDLIIQKVAHVGVAVASGDFIFVPVIGRPIEKTLLRVAQELAAHIQLVRDNKLTPDHTQGGTITLTNMGVADLKPNAGLSIIRQPEVASIAMGRIKDTVVPVNGEIVIRPMMGVTFSYDHRVVMGVPGGRFAESVRYYLENPELLLAC